MVEKTRWLVGLSALLVACEKGTGTGPPLPPCTSGGTAITLAVGQYASVDPGPISGCTVFPAAAANREYLLVPQAATGTPNDSQTFRVGGAVVAAGHASIVAPQALAWEIPAAERFHLMLRQAERARAYPGARRPASGSAHRAPPVSSPLTPADSGTKRTFKVCGDLQCETLPNVSATLMKLGQHIAIYVDDDAPQPPSGLSQADLDELRAVFDTRLYDVDRLAFGDESDIDGNGVVIVLMTTRVNELVTAAQCASGFVAGFFFGADIDPFWVSQNAYNNGEVFYSLVADPGGTLRSCAHSVDQVKRTVPVTFVHEFQHMISFNQHVLVRDGEPDVLWLNEALSHYAEELGGRSFLPGDTASYCRYVAGDLYNAAQYLQAPHSFFLVDTAGIGGLANRGAYWLFLRYLIDRFAADTSVAQRNAFTSGLVLTNLTGAANVTARTGVLFPTLLARWALANWVSDLSAFPAPPELQYKMWRFRTDYATLKTACAGAINADLLPNTLPLTPAQGAGNAVMMSGVLRAGSGTYFRALQASSDPGFTLLFSDGSGSALRGSLVPRLNIIRIQ